MTFLMVVISVSTLILSMRASPFVLASAPMMILMSVDLPAPFYPSNATIYPFLSWAVTPVRA